MPFGIGGGGGTSRGVAPNGEEIQASFNGDGHQEIAVLSPRLPFGSLHTENLTPVFQSDGVYGLNSQLNRASTSGSGVATTDDSSFSVSTGTTVNSYADIQSRKRLKYRPGQGSVGRFAAVFTTPVADSYQIAGLGHAEDGFYFGYKGTDFGILHVDRGVRATHTLTVTVGSSTAQSITVTLNGTAYTVTVTNSASTLKSAYEISLGTYAGWTASAVGSTVVFVANTVGAKAGAFSISGTTIAGTFATTKAGAASTDTFVKQADWTGDKMDGTGLSGYAINPTKGNVFQIGIQYLGYGVISFYIEVSSTANHSSWVLVHELRIPNTRTKTTVGNPTFPFTMAVYSAGSTTNLTLKVGSFFGGVEGNIVFHGPRFSYYGQSSAVGATNLQALFTVKNELVFAGRSNQCVVNLLNIAAAVKHTSPVILYLVRNGVLSGNPNFQAMSSNSCTTWDTAATTVTYTTGDQLLWTGHLGDTGNLAESFLGSNLTLQPGESLTLAARAVTGTPSYVTGSINTREDV